MRWTGALVCLGLAAAGVPALAHHSIAAMYDRDKTVEVQGVLSKLDLQNPHTLIEITVAEGAGRSTVWVLESGGVQRMSRIGFDRTSVLVGDKVTVTGSPARQGEHQLWLTRLQTSAGKRFEFNFGRQAAP